MTDNELHELEEIAKYSGFPRQRGSRIVLKLIEELRRYKASNPGIMDGLGYTSMGELVPCEEKPKPYSHGKMVNCS